MTFTDAGRYVSRFDVAFHVEEDARQANSLTRINPTKDPKAPLVLLILVLVKQNQVLLVVPLVKQSSQSERTIYTLGNLEGGMTGFQRNRSCHPRYEEYLRLC